jgi:hypothetical protein
LKTDAHFHLFLAVAESHLPAPPPTSTESNDCKRFRRGGPNRSWTRVSVHCSRWGTNARASARRQDCKA